MPAKVNAGRGSDVSISELRVLLLRAVARGIVCHLYGCFNLRIESLVIESQRLGKGPLAMQRFNLRIESLVIERWIM